MNPDFARRTRLLVRLRSEWVRTEIARVLEMLRVTGIGVTNRQVEEWITSKKTTCGDEMRANGYPL